MASITESIVAALETRLNDPSVSWFIGKRRISQNSGKRKVIVVREKGSLLMSKAPKGMVEENDQRKRIRFQRSEVFRFSFHAETEEILDQLFDNVLNAIWLKFAPDVFDDENEYSWVNGDAENGGAVSKSNPCIVLLLTFRLKTSPTERLTTEIEETELTTNEA